MKIVATGGPGQLVLSLTERLRAGDDQFVAVGPPQLDLSRNDDAAVYDALAAQSPDVIINAAAHTAVDRAETEHDLAFAINARGAGAVARAAKRMGTPIVHVSTDYVFAGNQSLAYDEDDPTGPTGVYGRSKLDGERAVGDSGADFAIVRTAWVYSPFGSNFVKTMLRLATTHDEVAVVADQFGCPTSALDLADACVAVARHLVGNANPGLRGLFHATGSGDATWADFAEAIFASSATIGGPSARVRRITTAEYPTAAMRPANSRLSCEKLAAVHAIRLPAWRDSLQPVTARLVAEIEENRL